MNRFTSLALWGVLVTLFSTFIAQAQPLRLEVSPTTMETWIANISPNPISVDAYQISSNTGILDIVGWQSIDESATANPAAVTAALGSGALSFVDPGGSNAYFMVELNPSNIGTWQPGTRWSIGYPFGTVLSALQSTLPANPVFSYTFPSGGVIEGSIVVLPEPSTCGLLVLASCSMLLRRP